MLISDSYREQNRELHKNPEFGVSGHKCAHILKTIMPMMKVTTALDYGCGKQTLQQALPEYTITGYDPAIEGLDREPSPHDLVVCTDVLEHIEPEYLDDVLTHLKQLTKRRIIFTVHTQPAKKTLPDGRNAHLILQEHSWWLGKLMNYFTLEQYIRRETKELDDHGFMAIMRND